MNDGSPSGFLADDCVPEEYSTKSSSSSFSLPIVRLRSSTLSAQNPSRIPNAYLDGDNTLLYPAHPVFLDHLIDGVDLAPEVVRQVRVAPTASIRTVYDLENGVFVKLHYPGEIGRFSRMNPMPKWKSSFQNSELLWRKLHSGNAPSDTAMLNEFAGVMLSSEQVAPGGAGMIFREVCPVPNTEETSIIPFFSLFARDQLASDDPTLLEQILRQSDDPREWLETNLLVPLINSYVWQAIEVGIIPEMNAQNVLMSLPHGNHGVRIVYRDMMGNFKDNEFLSTHTETSEFEGYHMIDVEFDRDEAFRRRSFCYDFKLGEYILSPIEALANSLGVVRPRDFRSMVRDYFHSILPMDAENYFGSNETWWSYPNVHPKGQRPYQRNDAPKYR